jgi:hypothetical protein
MDVAPQVEAGIGRARGGGRALPASVRQPLELAFGADFHRVRVHADGAADALNRVLNARAFTTGQNIFLRRGYFSPESSSGKELLAHELAHVVQQDSGVTRTVVQRFTDEDVKVRAYYNWQKKGNPPPKQTRQEQEEDYFQARRELVQQEEAVKLVDNDKALNPSVAAEIKASLSAPEKIDQGQFNFCGPNDVLMAIALKDPVAYVKYVLDVHAAERELKAGTPSPGRKAHLGKMPVAMDPNVIGAAAATFPLSGAATNISQTDWMSMGSIRKQATATAPVLSVIPPKVQAILTGFYIGGAPDALKAMKDPADLETAIMVLKKGLESTPSKKLEELALVNALAGSSDEMERKIAEGSSPDEMAQWLKSYGATDVIKAAEFDNSKIDKDLLAANKDLAAGKSVMLQIDAPAGLQGSHAKVTFDPTMGHWVLMNTPFKSSGAPDPVWTCDVYSWGTIRVLTIVESQIRNAYYGRVSATITTP